MSKVTVKDLSEGMTKKMINKNKYATKLNKRSLVFGCDTKLPDKVRVRGSEGLRLE